MTPELLARFQQAANGDDLTDAERAAIGNWTWVGNTNVASAAEAVAQYQDCHPGAEMVAIPSPSVFLFSRFTVYRRVSP